ncbi:hypothetical protein KI387_044596, partial [Taxus chinensis]
DVETQRSRIGGASPVGKEILQADFLDLGVFQQLGGGNGWGDPPRTHDGGGFDWEAPPFGRSSGSGSGWPSSPHAFGSRWGASLETSFHAWLWQSLLTDRMLRPSSRAM